MNLSPVQSLTLRILYIVRNAGICVIYSACENIPKHTICCSQYDLACIVLLNATGPCKIVNVLLYVSYINTSSQAKLVHHHIYTIIPSCEYQIIMYICRISTYSSRSINQTSPNMCLFCSSMVKHLLLTHG